MTAVTPVLVYAVTALGVKGIEQLYVFLQSHIWALMGLNNVGLILP